ncbi:MAG: hypothetical protein COB66_02585 [Coxiella sp. (in: Bacteria)]|nr:MAG: hypothetical protein COB66_02585 [Coxiella sp. (in: g-proteobacteria)]
MTFTVEEYQRLQTSGARGATLFTIENTLYLGVPQLAEDIGDAKGDMNSGNSDVDSIIFIWHEGKFTEYQRIPCHGAESIEYFSIGERHFIAIANIRSGTSPNYDMHTQSKLYEWDGHLFNEIQQFDTFAAKNAHAFMIDNDHYLAFAEGVIDGADNGKTNTSNLYKWDGAAFTLHQSFPSAWGYCFYSFMIDNTHYLAFADQIGASVIYVLKKDKFEPFQSMSPDGGGRAFLLFSHADTHYLAFANMMTDSVLYQWDGRTFIEAQTLTGKAGRYFSILNYKNEQYLLRNNFISGSREAPQTKLKSVIYEWKETDFSEMLEITTYGATQMNAFKKDGDYFIVVSNSLSDDIRFRTDSVVYKIA